MSPFTTQNGLTVTCADPTCLCNTHPTFSPTVKPATAGGLDAEDQERWFDELCDAVEEYLHAYVEHREAVKSDRERLAVKVHEAKSVVIERFYANGWKS